MMTGASTADPIFFHSYCLNSATGSFILIDPATSATAAVGTMRGETQADTQVSAEMTKQGWNIARRAYESPQGHRASVV